LHVVVVSLQLIYVAKLNKLIDRVSGIRNTKKTKTHHVIVMQRVLAVMV
jgi:hypothetical protein